MSFSNTTNQPNRHIEPEVDYGLWERLYGKTLTDTDKLEIRINLTAFFEVLIDEHKKSSKSK